MSICASCFQFLFDLHLEKNQQIRANKKRYNGSANLLVSTLAQLKVATINEQNKFTYT